MRKVEICLKVYNLNEITDSKIVYDKKPPSFMKYIILIVTVLIVISLVWANKSVKTYVVKGQGVVTTENKAYIMMKISGEIREVFVREGSRVNEGDILFTTNGMETEIQLEQVNSQIDIYNKRIELLRKAEENATKGTNKFDQNNEVEKEFYNKLSAAYLARKEFNVDREVLKSQGYEGEEVEGYINSQKIKETEHYYKTIAEFTNEKVQYETEVAKLVSQKASLNKSKGQYEVKASKSGIIHLESTITSGMVLQGGTLIGSITSNEEELIIETMIPSIDRPRINMNNEVSLAVGGLNQAEYGTIEGTVVSIAEDATIDTEKGTVYFKAKIKPNQTYLTDSKDEKVSLVVGMVTETRVKYEKITYMRYLLELIGVNIN